MGTRNEAAAASHGPCNRCDTDVDWLRALAAQRGTVKMVPEEEGELVVPETRGAARPHEAPTPAPVPHEHARPKPKYHRLQQ